MVMPIIIVSNMSPGKNFKNMFLTIKNEMHYLKAIYKMEA